VAKRRELAERAAAAYAQASAVAAVILGGSVSRDEHDRFSDIELGVFWETPPTDDDRAAAVARAGGEVLRLFPYAERDAAWFDDWLLDGVVVEAVNMTTDAMSDVVHAVIARFDPDADKQVVVAALMDGVVLRGDDVVARWRAAAREYPDGLVRAVVEQQASVANLWHLEMAVARDNPFLAYRKIVEVHERMLRVLLAVNRVYWYGFKSLDGLESRMPVAPRDLAARIREAYRVDLRDVEPLVTALVEETYDLVERHVPGVDVDALRRGARFRHLPRED
jgi:hypothetical protein